MILADPRRTLARPDLADIRLQGLVSAATYRATRRLRVIAPCVGLMRAPDESAERLDELIFGEEFDALNEEAAGFVWGQARRDGYVGYVSSAALAEPVPAPTHRVTALRTYAFADASYKSRAEGPYSLGALVSVEREAGDFAVTPDGAHFWAAHLAPIGRGFETDPVTVAARFLGTPYLWGGRTSVGLDCSGLVQQALYACGLACPRDNDQQAELGAAVGGNELTRGDLVCWGGHIGLMLDDHRLLHANAHHMAVTIEPLDAAVARIQARGDGPPTAYRRLSSTA